MKLRIIITILIDLVMTLDFLNAILLYQLVANTLFGEFIYRDLNLSKLENMGE